MEPFVGYAPIAHQFGARLADRDLVTREKFEAVRAMVQKARSDAM